MRKDLPRCVDFAEYSAFPSGGNAAATPFSGSGHMSASVETQLRKAQKALASHQSAAAHEALRYLSDSQLKALGCTRENFVRKAEERLMNEFTSKDATTNSAVPVNPNLVGAV